VSRDGGFDRMDVSTSLPDDRKFRALARRHPDLLAAAGWAYLGLLAMSWREGERLTLEEGWPALLPYDEAAADALREARLVDDELRIPEHAWAAWYVVACERRRLGRDRQKRADIKRGHTNPETPLEPPAVRQTASQSVSQAGPTLAPTPGQRWHDAGTTEPRRNSADRTTCPTCGDLLSDKDPNVLVADHGRQLMHRACPGIGATA
jgi:hypothetical protein